MLKLADVAKWPEQAMRFETVYITRAFVHS